jgi:hypothetical protein
VTSSLHDEIALREASIADARRELADGELTEEQCAAVIARESAAITKCRAALSALPLASPSASVRQHRRTLLFVAMSCFLVAIVVTLFAALAPRQPGSSITGGVTGATQAHVTQQLVNGEIDESAKHDAAALAAFNEVLVLEPTNIEALTQSGWLTFSAGSAEGDLPIVRLGEQRIETAVNLDPTYPSSRLYYAIAAALTPGQRSLAIEQFTLFLKLKPSSGLRAVALPWLKFYKLSTATQ